ncbi:MAG: hypothetical protein QM695_02825 [Micropruina sp.]
MAPWRDEHAAPDLRELPAGRGRRGGVSGRRRPDRTVPGAAASGGVRPAERSAPATAGTRSASRPALDQVAIDAEERAALAVIALLASGISAARREEVDRMRRDFLGQLV